MSSARYYNTHFTVILCRKRKYSFFLCTLTGGLILDPPALARIMWNDYRRGVSCSECDHEGVSILLLTKFLGEHPASIATMWRPSL